MLFLSYLCRLFESLHNESSGEVDVDHIHVLDIFGFCFCITSFLGFLIVVNEHFIRLFLSGVFFVARRGSGLLPKGFWLLDQGVDGSRGRRGGVGGSLYCIEYP